jgi:hypothetical protein
MDCEICYENNSKLVILTCKHKLCYNCYLKLVKLVCPFCRTEFKYSNKDNKLKIQLGLYNNQSNNDYIEIEHEYSINFDNIIENNKKIQKHKNYKIKDKLLIKNRQYNINKRETKKWTFKDIRLEKNNYL